MREQLTESKNLFGSFIISVTLFRNKSHESISSILSCIVNVVHCSSSPRCKNPPRFPPDFQRYSLLKVLQAEVCFTYLALRNYGNTPAPDYSLWVRKEASILFPTK